MGDALAADAIAELHRRLALHQFGRLAVYKDWYQEQLAAGLDKDTLHAIQAMDAVVRAMGSAGSDEQLLLLIHGIRTQAEWQGMVRQQLIRTGTAVEPIQYEYLDAIRFWFPLFTRRGSLKQILWKIRHAVGRHPNAKLTIIAHSYGTYAVTKLLRDNPDIKCSRLILCGSIIKRGFRWDMLANCPGECINDSGSRDIWPVLAEALSWGYGASGTFGFGTPGITERAHDFKHSDYFTAEFVKKFWEPWIHGGVCVPSEYEHSRPPSPWCLSVLPLLQLRWLLPPAILIGGYYLYRWLFG